MEWYGLVFFLCSAYGQLVAVSSTSNSLYGKKCIPALQDVGSPNREIQCYMHLWLRFWCYMQLWFRRLGILSFSTHCSNNYMKKPAVHSELLFLALEKALQRLPSWSLVLIFDQRRSCFLFVSFSFLSPLFHPYLWSRYMKRRRRGPYSSPSSGLYNARAAHL